MSDKNNMNEQEGVIKYSLQHHYSGLQEKTKIEQINAWRTVLFRLKLIGQSSDKYQGLGYGNISQRLAPDTMPFLISGTQTAYLECLSTEDFAIVESASPTQNAISSKGPCKPSSEALTHASVYLHDAKVQAVIHVHCPEIWHNTLKLQLPHTTADIAYGTVEMAEAVANLFSSGQLACKPIFCMLGHEDGVVSFGDSLESAAITLLSQYAKALAVEQSNEAG